MPQPQPTNYLSRRYLDGGSDRNARWKRCVCGKEKENPRRRYCAECFYWNGLKMHEVLSGRPRKKGVATT